MPRDTTTERNHRGALSRAGTAYIRTRTVSACQVCRARRAKCDNERPCSNCRRIGATCSSEPVSSTAGFDPASLAILTRLEDLHNEVKTISSHLHGSHPSSYHNPGGSSVDTVPERALRALHLDRHLQRGNLKQVLAWDVWQPYSSPSNLDITLVGSGFNITTITSNEAPGSERGFDLGRFTEHLDAFFRNVHILNPVLDERIIRNQLTNSMLSGIGWDARSCLLLLVLANGACSIAFTQRPPESHLRGRDETRWASAQALFDAAEKRKDTLWRTDHLTQARCHFYTGIFMMVSMRAFDAWRCFLLGLASCQKMTVSPQHREPRDPAQVEKQAEESIYWSCWKSERELRFELDLPDFTAAGYEHPVMFPTLPRVTDQEELRAWYFYLAEISLWRSEMTARQTMAEFAKREPNALEALAQRVIDLDMSLVSWRESLPTAIRLDEELAHESRDVLLFVLRGRLTYNYEVLTWPFVETLISSMFNEHESPQAAELAARGVRMHYDRLVINRPGLYYRHHGTWLMQCSSARSACVLLAVARSSAAHLLPGDWLELVSNIIEMLEYWNEGHDSAVVSFLRSIQLEFVHGL